MDQQGKSVVPGLKICGLTTPEDTAYCLRQGVAYLGFNFFVGSKRFIEPEAAARIWAQCQTEGQKSGAAGQGQSLAVAVVVDHAPAALAAALAAFPALAAVQCHGQESPEDLAALRPLLAGRALWKALPVASSAAIEAASRYTAAADLLLFDAAVIPPGATVAGGSGHSFAWDTLAAYRGPLPYGVAGGLKAGNLATLAAATRSRPPALVDLCSGVESAPGRKDHAAISLVMQAMRAFASPA